MSRRNPPPLALLHSAVLATQSPVRADDHVRKITRYYGTEAGAKALGSAWLLFTGTHSGRDSIDKLVAAFARAKLCKERKAAVGIGRAFMINDEERGRFAALKSSDAVPLLYSRSDLGLWPQWFCSRDEADQAWAAHQYRHLFPSSTLRSVTIDPTVIMAVKKLATDVFEIVLVPSAAREAAINAKEVTA